MNDEDCPFCQLIQAGILYADFGLVVAIADRFPVAPGHTLLVPRRHEPDFFELTRDEHVALIDAALAVRSSLASKVSFDGVNLGLNNGEAAGQTVMHCHLHFIPRQKGDVPDPRGGVRWVFPGSAPYWTEP